MRNALVILLAALLVLCAFGAALADEPAGQERLSEEGALVMEQPQNLFWSYFAGIAMVALLIIAIGAKAYALRHGAGKR
ncbi:MAG: hypothetical protein LBN26_10340 [Christensenellaceae bacterium]|jgi:hypothetical protein|nr:hypothetical protein [Christensenellaceae bacterium]